MFDDSTQKRPSFVSAILSAFTLAILANAPAAAAQWFIDRERPPVIEEQDPEEGSAFETRAATARFLTQASFGPTQRDIDRLVGTEAADWFLEQIEIEPSLHIPIMESYQAREGDDSDGEITANSLTFAFFQNATAAPDQLRQRMAFALSQILVVSNFGGELLTDNAFIVGHYQDLLINGALGNYRDLLEDVTYSPAMGFYLTYLGNEKADPRTGRMPDENYAREILQLFTLGVVELDTQGQPVLDSNGNAIELYDNRDITGLAKVFTGLDFAFEFPSFAALEDAGDDIWARPMSIRPAAHSMEAKSFLGLTIPRGTGARASIDMTLDHIMAHPNIGPFIARQLIQRFVTSHPSPEYIERVSSAFDTGAYQLPNYVWVGEGRKGDLTATLAAILFDDDARGARSRTDVEFGKVREPVIRLVNFARAFEVPYRYPEMVQVFYDLNEPLGQHPYRSRSVFNFYRPGYVAPRSITGASGMTVPELQIFDATSTAGYANVMTFLLMADRDETHVEFVEEFFEEIDFDGDPSQVLTAYVADLEREIALAHDSDALVDHLDGLLTYGQLSDETRAELKTSIDLIPMDHHHDSDSRRFRSQLAVLLMMTSPDYLVQR